MTLLLLLGRGAAFISENLWPAVALGFLAVVIAPAIWSRRRDRQRAAMAVIGVILQAVTTVVVTRRRSRRLWQDVFADLLTSEEQLPLPAIGSARIRRAHTQCSGHRNHQPVPAPSAMGELRPASPGSGNDPNQPPTVEDVDRRDVLGGAVALADLQALTAATMEHAAWLAYDAGWQQRARRWRLETCHLADLAGIPEVRVIALASMALQAGDDPGCGAETVILAQAARSAAGDHASPTVLSVLVGREAIARMRSGIAALSEVVDADRMEQSIGTASVCLMGRELQ